jgi:NAD(P)-dependent dehydrogenase (short-subunit alcohol dehydrogenase family)
MDLQMNGKTALVTGGSAGIGKAIAFALAREGVDAITPRPTWVIAPARKPVVSNRKPPIRNVQRTTTRRARDRSSNSATT